MFLIFPVAVAWFTPLEQAFAQSAFAFDPKDDEGLEEHPEEEVVVAPVPPKRPATLPSVQPKPVLATRPQAQPPAPAPARVPVPPPAPARVPVPPPRDELNTPGRDARLGRKPPTTNVGRDEDFDDPTELDDPPEAGYRPGCRNCSQRPEAPRIRAPIEVRLSPSITGTPVGPAFARNFNRCMNELQMNCQPVGVGIHRRGGSASCHHFGKAIDVAGIRCGDGRTYCAASNLSPGNNCIGPNNPNASPNPTFARFVQCMSKGMHHIYFGRRRYDHANHAHFSMGCSEYGMY